MRLIITHHAFIRLGDWHPEYKGLVPPGKVTLNAEQASRLITALGVMVWSMEYGRPSVLLERVDKRKREKYGRRSFYIYDRESYDLFQLIQKSETTFTLVTITCIRAERREQILDEPKPEFRFSETTEIAIPYLLNFEASRQELGNVVTPSGRVIPVSYGCHIFGADDHSE